MRHGVVFALRPGPGHERGRGERCGRCLSDGVDQCFQYFGTRVAVINAHEPAALTLAEALDAGKITYIPFSEGLREKYQSGFRADVAALRSTLDTRRHS